MITNNQLNVKETKLYANNSEYSFVFDAEPDYSRAKAGDTVVAAGLIPLRIYVSDSSKISVKYVGAKVSVPSAKQVNFELPKQ